MIPGLQFSPDGKIAGQDDSPLDTVTAREEGTTVAESIDVTEVVSALAELSTTTPTKKRQKWVEKKPAGDVAAELSAPVASTTSKAPSPAVTGPALAAVVSRPNPYTDVRLKQGSVLTDSAMATSPRPSSRSPRVAPVTPLNIAAAASSIHGGQWTGNAPWQQEFYVHPSRLTVEAPGKGHVFSDMVHPRCRHSTRDYHNSEDVYMSKKYTYNVEYMTNKCLRHSSTLQVSQSGWAYMRDVAYTLWVTERKYGYIGQVSEADIMYAIDVSQSDKQRFIVSALDYQAGLRPGNMMIKAVQGVSTQIGRQIIDKEAYTPVSDIPALSHYTSLSLIDDFVGFQGKGIVPGGILNRSSRSHCYFVPEQPPNNGLLPNSFWKSGTDCVIELHAAATQAYYECLQTENGTILIGAAVAVQFLARVTLLGSARYTIWLNPNAKQLQGVTQRHCTCAKRGAKYVNGTQWCYRKCWVPITWFGVQQRFMMVVDLAARDKELYDVYGLPRRQRADKQSVPGSVPYTQLTPSTHHPPSHSDPC